MFRLQRVLVVADTERTDDAGTTGDNTIIIVKMTFVWPSRLLGRTI